ncbi:MAG: cupin domain-containing protein [Pseudomonadota bacterium]
MKRLLVITLSSLWVPLASTAVADEPVSMVRLTAAEIAALAAAVPANPTGPTMTVLVGDPKLPGLYTVRVAIPAHTQVKPHTHRDNRSVTVLSGTWQLGYGSQFDAKLLKELKPGSLFTEPAGQPHFSQTVDEPVVILVTGYGPNDTKFVTP